VNVGDDVERPGLNRGEDRDENRPRGSERADGEQRIPANERTHLPAVSVFPGLRLKVD
jgi:hypothetical protein